MRQLRNPAVAGLFYTGQPDDLRAEVQGLLVEAIAAEAGCDLPARPKAIIAPHAGYPFSGPIAASAYAAVAALAGEISRVVLLGPGHRLGFTGLARSQADAFLTPLGAVPVDQTALASLTDLPQVHALERAFDGEHCLEVQLPFLQVLLGEFTLVPLLVGSAAEAEVSAVLERLWGGPETLIVISSDLSHYLPYAAARALDARTSAAICALQGEAIGPEQACGRTPILGLLHAARAHGLTVRLLDLRNSGDTAGPRDRVVGYGAYVLG